MRRLRRASRGLERDRRSPARVSSLAARAPRTLPSAIRHARTHDLEIGVKCGGHSVLGLCCAARRLMIDLTPMDSVRVDPASRVPRSVAARSSATWTRPRRRMAWPRPPATCRYRLGRADPRRGWDGLPGRPAWRATTSSLHVVTAVARPSAPPHRPSDLVWGLRGGGGNFGVVTDSEFRLHPVPACARRRAHLLRGGGRRADASLARPPRRCATRRHAHCRCDDRDGVPVVIVATSGRRPG